MTDTKTETKTDSSSTVAVTPFNQFLQRARKRLTIIQTLLKAGDTASLQKQQLFVTLGNEAGDLDSQVTAMAYGSYLDQINGAENNPLISVVPVINFPRKLLLLRQDAVYLYQNCAIDVDSLVFIDEIQLTEISKVPSFMRMVLVDHNRLADQQGTLGDLIHTIIDHHANENLYKPTYSVITVVGSCCSLVTLEMNANKAVKIHAPLDVFLASVILLDTSNMSVEGKKVTDTDTRAYDILNQTNKWTLDYQTAHHKKLADLRKDISMLTSDLLLWKDTKFDRMPVPNGQIIPYAVITAPIDMRDWFKNDPNVLSVLSNFCSDNEMMFIVVGGSQKAPKSRQLLLYTPVCDANDCKSSKYSVELLNQFVQYLQTSTNFNVTALDLPGASTVGRHWVLPLLVANPDASRKKVIPAIKSFLTSYCT